MHYSYDVFDRRIAKTIDADGAGSALASGSHYVYDGLLIALAFDADGSLTNRYLHGPAVDQVLADEQFAPTTPGEQPTSPGDVLWPLADNQGTVRDIADSTGAILNHRTYSATGQITAETDPTVNELFGFHGGQQDPETGNLYRWHRYTDLALGAWLSEDPLSFAAGDTNLQRYVGNSPTNFTDPTGLHYPEGGSEHSEPTPHQRAFAEYLQRHPILPPGVQGPLPKPYHDMLADRRREFAAQPSPSPPADVTGNMADDSLPFFPPDSPIQFPGGPPGFRHSCDMHLHLEMMYAPADRMAIGAAPNPELIGTAISNILNGTSNYLRETGHEEAAFRLDSLFIGPKENPAFYDENGNYTGPVYGGLPPIGARRGASKPGGRGRAFKAGPKKSMVGNAKGGVPHGPLKPGILTKADSILDAACPTFKSNWAKKVSNKYSWLRNRLPGTKTVIEGSRSQKLAQAQKIIMDRVRQGGGQTVDHVGGKAIKYVDGAVSYFFRLDGTFWGIRKNF